MVLTLGLGVLAGAIPIAAACTSHANLLHARAAESFRQGRFPEAYGYFIGLANAGHAASDGYALWMCEAGPGAVRKRLGLRPSRVGCLGRAIRRGSGTDRRVSVCDCAAPVTASRSLSILARRT